MKSYGWLISLFLSITPIINTYGGWQVANPSSTVPEGPFFQAGTQEASPRVFPAVYSARAFPNQYAKLGQPAAVYAVSMSGSLKENIERIMYRYHWKVIWKAPYDYNFDGRVSGPS